MADFTPEEVEEYLTEICNAIKRNDVETIQRILMKKKVTDRYDAKSCLFSFFVTNINIMNLFIELGLDVNFPYFTDNQTFLHRAVSAKQKDVVLRLLECNANPNAISGLYLTPLKLATSKNNQEIAELLIQHGADLNLVILDPKGAKTPLYHASIFKNIPFMKMLLKYGADINYQLKTNETVLHSNLTLRHDSHNVISFLLKNGADVMRRSSNPVGTLVTPLEYANNTNKKVYRNILLSHSVILYSLDKKNKPNFDDLIDELTKKFDMVVPEDKSTLIDREIQMLKNEIVSVQRVLDREINFTLYEILAMSTRKLSRKWHEVFRDSLNNYVCGQDFIMYEDYFDYCRNTLLEEAPVYVNGRELLRDIIDPIVLPENCIEQISSFFSVEEFQKLINDFGKLRN